MPVLSGAAILMLVVIVVVAWRQARLSLWRFLLSVLGVLLGSLLVTGGAQLAWGEIQKNLTSNVAANSFSEPGTALMGALMIAAVLLMAVILVLLSRGLGEINLAAAAVVAYLAAWFAAYWLIEGFNPMTTTFVAWPILGGVAGVGVMLFAKNWILRLALLAFSALVVVVLMIPALILESFTPEDAWISVLIVCVTMGLLAPQLEVIFGRTHQKTAARPQG